MNKAHPDGDIGFTAQNIEAVLPQLVGETDQPENAPIKLPGGKQKVLEALSADRPQGRGREL